MMPRLRLRLLDAMGVVLFAAIILGLWTFLDREPIAARSQHESPLAVYVAVLCTALIGARFGRARWRPFWGGLSFFGSVYLVVGLQMAWGIDNSVRSHSLLVRRIVAAPLGILCGMAAQRLVVPKPLVTEPEN